MKTALKIVASLVLILALSALAGVTWAKSKSADRLERTVMVHDVDFPIPFPLTADEVAAEGFTPEQADSTAEARAVERGRHLVESRFACTVCHGADFSGGVMVDAPVMGRILGPNLTAGAGSRTAGYTPADWDRIVRHGVRADGRVAAMPSEDFRRMSDRELSDVVAYVRSVPPVDNEVPPVTLGPLGSFLVATGKLPLSADMITDHFAAHRPEPPEAAVSVEFGEHLAGVCMGCHSADMAGGKVPGGDPAWVPASNLTPHVDGLSAWSYDDFVAAMREGRRPDGSALKVPMSDMLPFTQRMTDTELEALWAYLRSVPAVPTDG